MDLATTNVWVSRSGERLTLALARIAKHLELPLSGVNFERVCSTDSESFRRRKIPRITLHSLTQKTGDDQLLHSTKDRLSAIDLDAHYDSHHQMAMYLVYLDHLLAIEGKPQAASP